MVVIELWFAFAIFVGYPSVAGAAFNIVIAWA